ncbi:MAG: PilW family protein [Rhodoferax sp.]|nr:PilW family protein [Rhodoferax sp.]
MTGSFPTAQRGLTMVELLVSLVLASLITLAAVALYTVTGSSYRTIDAAQELQDSGRFALEVIGQAARQAGYQNYAQRDGSGNENTRRFAATSFPTVRGFNNAKVASPTNIDDDGATNNGGYNNSDTLALRFHGSSKLDNAVAPDDSMIDCQGVSQNYPANGDDVALSLFWVKTDSTGEPALQCISRGNPKSPGLSRNTQPILKGVETFQVMYGLDTDGDSVPEKWVSGQNVADWKQVAAIRVGFVIRGAPGSSQGPSANAADNKLYPLGKEFTGSSTEAGLVFTLPNDGRLRRVFNATFKLRNPQD